MDSIKDKLFKEKKQKPKPEEAIISEVYKILNNDLLDEKKILNNLSYYINSFEKICEEELSYTENIFTNKEIKSFCVKYRLKFLDIRGYQNELPYEAILKIKHLNELYRKNLKEFKVISFPANFFKKDNESFGILFAKTNHGNYYLIHSWGKNLNNWRKWLYWPMRNFEKLFTTVIIISAILAVSLPTKLIWLPQNASYWGGYRLGAFMHILIFNLGVTAYITFAFSGNFSSSNWNTEEDF